MKRKFRIRIALEEWNEEERRVRLRDLCETRWFTPLQTEGQRRAQEVADYCQFILREAPDLA